MKNTSSSYNTKKTIALLVVGYLFALGGSVIGVIIGETIGSKQQKMSSDASLYIPRVGQKTRQIHIQYSCNHFLHWAAHWLLGLVQRHLAFLGLKMPTQVIFHRDVQLIGMYIIIEP